MKIIRYKCASKGNDDWNFSPVEFGRVNLLVGDTATGKTRFLNTIFNIGTFVRSDDIKIGTWDITFQLADSEYRWFLETDSEEDPQKARIITEKLWKIENGGEHSIVDRVNDVFIFRDEKLPKLSPRITSISLLKEEEVIKPIYEGFGLIRRRRFFSDDLANISKLEAIPPNLVDRFKNEESVESLYEAKLNLNANLFIISRLYKDIYERIKKQYKDVFPFIHQIDIRDLSQISANVDIAVEVPIFCIREKGSSSWIPLPEMSSGMQKVLLILTDTFILPNNAIYIIDEYENSLGINAIDFFPNFVLELDKEIQFIITSHHPYIINEIPPKNWYLFHRKGTNVNIKYGDDLEKRFGKSKQKAFTQLINDPIYTEGIE